MRSILQHSKQAYLPGKVVCNTAQGTLVPDQETEIVDVVVVQCPPKVLAGIKS